MQDLASLPVRRIGALEVDAFVPKTDRRALAAALNTLLASPTFSNWRQGQTRTVSADCEATPRATVRNRIVSPGASDTAKPRTWKVVVSGALAFPSHSLAKDVRIDSLWNW